ncbi:DUF3613 domain-containing protein [Bordetella petrii]|uniref:Secreted protein n=1 Tax=Bordetella petrii (strain ATCC BAA-461 / DSM 12804 / CCUG 43448 / CIP 107267 / Se-1111R) TaxID=340100 RepID=A9HX55_BORPD|nr:DUF3613 domain-containing protein [Bordetella petrii]CAP43715.1 putative secreted protein [Bordetella petrii]
MSRRFLRLPLALAAALPCVAAAQMNAPLTGGAAAQPAAVAAPAAPAAQAMPNRPVVRQVQTPMPAAAPQGATGGAAVASAPAQAASAPQRENFGDVTRGLLAAQADGRRAGGALPILGPVSTAAWNRYLESFRQPIPQWFTEKVKTDSK